MEDLEAAIINNELGADTTDTTTLEPDTTLEPETDM